MCLSKLRGKNAKDKETCIILLIDRVAAVFFVKYKRSLILAHLKDIYLFTKNFHKFKMLPGVANW
jgi:hypothetical protein